MQKEFTTKEFTVLTPFSIIKKDEINYSDFTSTVEDPNVLKIAGYANWSGKDNDGKTYVDLSGDVVVPNGVDISVWSTNPQILWQHDRVSTIGKGTSLEKRPDGIYIEAEIHAGAMEEQDWYRIKSGLVCMFSVGFRTQDGEFKEVDDDEIFFITKSLLLEVSIVSIPCNSKSSFSQIKSLEDGTFTSDRVKFLSDTEKGNDTPVSDKVEVDNNKTDKEESLMNIKVKRADLLSAADLDKFKELGGDVEAEVEVSLASFIKSEVAKEVATILAAKEAEVVEADRVAAEAKSAEDAAKEAEELATKEAEEKALAEEFSELKDLVSNIKAAFDAA